MALREGAQEKGRALRKPGGRRLAKRDSIPRWRATPVTPRWGKTKEIRSISWVGELSLREIHPLEGDLSIDHLGESSGPITPVVDRNY